MKTHPIELALVLALAALEALRPLLVALVLTLAGYRPRRSAVAQQPAAAPASRRTHRPAATPAKPAERPQAAPEALELLTVRQLARQAGHRGLARNGSREALLVALAA